MITIQSTNDIYNSLKSNVESKMNLTINIIGKVFLNAFCLAYAAKIKLLYLVLSQIQKNVAPDICDEETLLRYGKLKLNRYPYGPVEGQYTVQVNGSVGAVIRAGLVYKSDDDSLSPGILYQLDNAYTLVSTVDVITVRCLTGGELGKLSINDTMTSTEPIPLVNSKATVITESVQPIDSETIEDYRAAVVLAFRLEPKGGSGADYRLWSLDASGVFAVYPYAKSGESSAVIVYVEAKVSDSTDGKGTPTQLILDNVFAVINFSPDISLLLYQRGRIPLDVKLYTVPIIPKNVDITINNFQGLTSQIQIDITQALTAYASAIRPFIASADVVTNKNDIMDVNKIIQTISNTEPGSTYGSVTFKVSGITFTNYQFFLGYIPYLNSVNFV